jgi:two-component system, sensor histidine kinase RpfC
MKTWKPRAFATRIPSLVRLKGRDLLEFLANGLEHLRHVLVALRGRTDPPELEQGLIRMVFGLLVLVCFLVYAGRDGQFDEVEQKVLIATVLYFLASILILVRIVWAGDVSPLRRYAGMVVDNVGITYFMAMMGEAGTLMFGLYLFIIFGNGFRYGRTYLHVCQAMALAGFGSVLFLDTHWSNSIMVGVACLLAIVVLPFYVRVLAERVTDAKKRADDANQAKGRFLANVSHEMRTPLNGVIAMADVLRETSLTDSQREIVETLGTSADLLLAQIEDVLDMAKIEAGRVQIERRPFDLGKLISSSVKVVLPQARIKGIAVNTEIAPQAARWYLGDSHHLRQVLLNLLANAVKFTERGEITLRVVAISHGPSEERLRFEVRDTGIGIPQTKLDAIFEPFTQADDSITRVYGGTGLGTSIARQLVTLMGGRIGVSSTVGLGSLFWFELPLPHSEPVGLDTTQELGSTSRLLSTTAALAAQQQNKVTKIRGARVLVAEDNPTNQRVTKLILESAGHVATIVDNGEAALDALERGSFDLALFDLSMPIVSGLEALKLYQYTTQNPIPVLILSANVTTEVISECQQAGCAEFLPKPIRPTTLLDAIEHYVSRASSGSLPTAPSWRTDERPALTVVDTPAIDSSILADLGRLSTDPTFIERLLRGFRSDTERLVKSISDSLAARNYEGVKDAAHALKGGAGSVGAVQLVQLAVRFEKASHDVLRMKAAAWTEELVRAENAALTALENHIEERRRSSSQN